MFDTKPAANLPLEVPQIARNLIDHLSPQQRNTLAAALDRLDIELLNGRDGWLVARVSDWNPVDVLLKREANALHYQCNCGEFRTHAPTPCVHIVATVLE